MMDKFQLTTRTSCLNIRDKHYLLDESAKLTSDLARLSALLHTNDYISVANRLKLRNSVLLGEILGMSALSQDELSDVLKVLDGPPSRPLKRTIRDKIRSCVEELLRHLVEESKQFAARLTLNDFDRLFEKDGTFCNYLKRKLDDVGVWRLSPDFSRQMISAWGEATVDEFQKALGSSALFFEYNVAKSTPREARDDNCVHVCKSA